MDLYKRSRGEGFGAEVKRRIMTGTYVLSAGYYDAYYLKAQRVRQLINQDFKRAFGEVDVLMGPTAPDVAFGIGAKASDPIQMYLNDIYTIGANLAGVPAMSIPCGFVRDLPVGLQIAARISREAQAAQRGACLPEGNRLASPDSRGVQEGDAVDEHLRLGNRHRPRDPRAALDEVEDLLGLAHGLWQRRRIRRPISSISRIRACCRCSTGKRCAWR